MTFISIGKESKLFGKKAKIIPCVGYDSKLFGMTGTLEWVSGLLFLRFDKESLENNFSHLEKGCFMSEQSFELLKEVE